MTTAPSVDPLAPHTSATKSVCGVRDGIRLEFPSTAPLSAVVAVFTPSGSGRAWLCADGGPVSATGRARFEAQFPSGRLSAT